MWKTKDCDIHFLDSMIPLSYIPTKILYSAHHDIIHPYKYTFRYHTYLQRSYILHTIIPTSLQRSYNLHTNIPPHSYKYFIFCTPWYQTSIQRTYILHTMIPCIPTKILYSDYHGTLHLTPYKDPWWTASCNMPEGQVPLGNQVHHQLLHKN